MLLSVKGCHPVATLSTAFKENNVISKPAHSDCIKSFDHHLGHQRIHFNASFLGFFPSHLAQPDMDIGMAGHHFSQQQAPPNQTAPWPDSMMPIDQTFVNQNR